jgi:hypothetical protein
MMTKAAMPAAEAAAIRDFLIVHSRPANPRVFSAAAIWLFSVAILNPREMPNKVRGARRGHLFDNHAASGK